jgi:hypothetical protein
MTMTASILCLECRLTQNKRRSHRLICHHAVVSRYQGPNNSNRMIFKKSSIVFLGLLTCAVVIVQALASSPGNQSPWGTRGGGAHINKKKRSLGIPNSNNNLSVHAVSESDMSSASSADESNNKRNNIHSEEDDEVEADKIPSPLIRPLKGISIGDKWKTFDVARSTPITVNGARSPTPCKSKKTILTPGGFSDAIIPATYIAETNLPNEFGHYRIRAYRIEDIEDITNREPNPLGAGAGLGNEPCVIYCTDKPPFGGGDGGAKEVPVRIHDQCFTSEVFGSQR